VAHPSLFRNRGCPVPSASLRAGSCAFARAGGDVACTILFVMPRGRHRSYGAHHLHFITCSCYHRLPFLRAASKNCGICTANPVKRGLVISPVARHGANLAGVTGRTDTMFLYQLHVNDATFHRRLHLFRFRLALLFVTSILSTTSIAQQKPTSAPNDIGDIALTVAAKNPGVLLDLGWATSVDPKAVQVNFQALDGSKLSKADIMRVTLQCLSAVAPFHPTMLIYARDGEQRLLMDGADIPPIANEFDHGNKLAAVRMFAEKVKKPSGEGIPLPTGLIARSTAAFDVADLLYKGGNSGDSSNGPSNDDNLAALGKSDKWKRSTPEEHGEVVEAIIRQCRTVQIGVKDGTRLEWKQVDAVFDTLQNLNIKAIADAKVALQQQEQDGKAEVPEGSSELLDLRIRYKEIFPAIDDSILVPLTSKVIYYAPESSFAGLTLHGKKGEVKGRITGKIKDWHSGVGQSSYAHSYYTTTVTTDSGRAYAGWSPDGNLVRWGDIKDKIAFDFSDKKLKEDSELERRALSQAN